METALSPAQLKTLEAFIDRIVPKDELGPGAVECGAANYIDRALADLNVALQLDPNLMPAYVNRGLIYEKTGDTANADIDILTARVVDPDIASTYARYDVAP